jgi:ATP-dependent DNA ligase
MFMTPLQIYSRNSENMTEKYPDVIQAKKHNFASHKNYYELLTGRIRAIL